MAEHIDEYIKKHHGTKVEFAKAEKLKHRQQITPWSKGDWIVHNGVLYSPRRVLISGRRGDD